MVKIRTFFSSIVPPKSPTPQGIIWNSNIDLVISNMYVTTVYFYQPDGSSNFFSLDILRDSLSEALVHFYPVAGRLKRDSSGRLEIHCNGAGVLLVEASTDSKLEDLGDFVPDPKLLQLVPQVDYSQDVSTWPLLILQVTVFQCGGVSIGVGMEHHVADGMSAIHFLNTWSDLARGAALKVQPFFDRTLLKARSPPAPTFPHVEYQPPPPLKPSSKKKGLGNRSSNRLFQKEGNGFLTEVPANKLDNREELSVNMFKFSREHLQKLETKASSNCEYKATYSSYEMLAAHIWKCICEARDLSPDQETKLYIAVDGRSRLRPPLPKGYFGNAIFTATPMSTAEDISSKPLYSTAGKIHDAVVRMNDEYLLSAIDFLELQPDLSKFVKGAHTFRTPNLGITSWAKLPMYDCDFGWGRPVYVGPAHLPLEGLAYVLQSPANDGSLSLCLALQAPHMLKFMGLIMEC